MKRNPKLETEGLLAGVRLAEKNIANKKFRGNSPDKSVSVRIDGKMHPLKIEINHEAFDISEEDALAISEATTQAMERAIENAQRSASRLLEEELKQDG